MAKAVASLLFDPAVKIDSLTPVQQLVLQAIQNYASAWAETAGFTEVAEDIGSITDLRTAYSCVR